MPFTAEKQMEQIGETRGTADRTHDLVQVLNLRIDSVWRYDQYIANADGKPDLQDFWRELKRQDQQCVDRLKGFLKDELDRECSEKQ